MEFIQDHLGLMLGASSVLAWPYTLRAPHVLLTREVVHVALLSARGTHPRAIEVDEIVEGRHAKHSFSAIAGHLLPEDYV